MKFVMKVKQLDLVHVSRIIYINNVWKNRVTWMSLGIRVDSRSERKESHSVDMMNF